MIDIADVAFGEDFRLNVQSIDNMGVEAVRYIENLNEKWKYK